MNWLLLGCIGVVASAIALLFALAICRAGAIEDERMLEELHRQAELAVKGGDHRLSDILAGRT